MPPNSSDTVNPLVNISMRRAVPPGAGSTTPLALQRSEFEDFANAYRRTLEVPRREPPEPPPPRTVEDSRGDFGRSIKKLMKRPQGSPSTKNNRKSGIQRTPTVVYPSSSHSDTGPNTEMRPMSEKKQKRPLSANIDTASISSSPQTPPSIAISGQSAMSFIPPPDPGLRLSNPDIQQSPVVPTPVSRKSIKVPKNLTPLEKIPKNLTPPEKSPKNLTPPERIPKNLAPPDDHLSTLAPPPILSHVQAPTVTNQVKKKVSIQEDNRRSGTEVYPDAHCLILSGNNIGRFLPPRHVSTEFPFVTYLVVNGSRHELAQKVQCVGSKPMAPSLRQLHFLAGYEETITISRPPSSTFPEKPASNKTGYVISLYQVLPGDDSPRFEQNWVMWTGARQLYRTIPDYMGLKKISVHKSVVPTTQTINYCVICELTNVMDHLTDACVVIDHLRARCCGFTGIYRIIDAL
ncbi:hypothetical protein JTE90_015588 [Oedothorax gibbosus]|uniref:DUF7153 domain-containing protein n=1 Tax=Oedothorax gibbosus TaxID=931172 RepID=A0AAV6U0V7_9ARAC|nr:hypothetical protein JTE90_015588 [Oedothorax gibbosus]